MRDSGRARSEDSGGEKAGSASAAPSLPVSLWGVLNVTPDSFSDGGAYLDPDRAIARAAQLVAEGADTIDVGGESTRPPGQTYGTPAVVGAEEELRRVLPVVTALVKRGFRVSVDTQKAAVAAQVLEVGAAVINDVSCGRDAELLARVAAYGCELVLMHNRGRGERAGDNTLYANVVADVRSELAQAVERAVAAGVQRARIWLDPGIGFAKTAGQSLSLLANTSLFAAMGHRVLIGTSRKSFIAETMRRFGDDAPSTAGRLGGSLASAALAVWHGADAVRTHDVADTRQAALVALALREARP